MARTNSSRWGSQLVMWSSPVLLLVMLFSMTSSARTQRSTHAPFAPRQVTTSVAPATPTTSTSSTTTSASTVPTSTTATAPARPTTRAANSFTATASSASSNGSGAAANVSNGAVTGVLAGGQVVDLPLNGPGSWGLTASAPVLTRLVCPRANTSFSNLIVIDSAQTCQLMITSSTSSATSWRLAPQP
jgi:hypothetical protein